MATSPAAPVPNPVQHRDANVLIGILAILEGVIWAGAARTFPTLSSAAQPASQPSSRPRTSNKTALAVFLGIVQRRSLRSMA